MESTQLARVVALLDEAQSDLLIGYTTPHGATVERALRAHDKITRAQNLLVGGRPTRAEDN